MIIQRFVVVFSFLSIESVVRTCGFVVPTPNLSSSLRIQQQQQQQDDETSGCSFWKRKYIHELSSTKSSQQESENKSSEKTRKKSSPTSSTTTNSSPSSTGSSSAFNNNNNGNAWEELHGNLVLRPSAEGGPPRALIHFLGGAIVGAVPQVSYRYVLERLAQEGYLVVATPYNLSFDHLKTCDYVIERFERIAPMLARQYGPVPVVGLGHSCGALLQLLITSLFPDTPRAANALLSFNNKPVQEAVPLFEQVWAPAFTSFAAKNTTSTPNSNDIITLSLQFLRSASEGELPSDEALQTMVYYIKQQQEQQKQQLSSLGIPLLPPLLPPLPPFLSSNNNKEKNENKQKESSLSSGDKTSTDDVTESKNHDLSSIVSIPTSIRDAHSTLVGLPALLVLESVLKPLVDTLDQIPLLIQEVADGARDFTPTPTAVRGAARRAYRARQTLIVQYKDDPIDESVEMETLLKEAQSMTRMKRPMVTNINVELCTLEGGHATPLLAPPLESASRAQDLLGTSAAQDYFQYAQAEETVTTLLKWLEQGNL